MSNAFLSIVAPAAVLSGALLVLPAAPAAESADAASSSATITTVAAAETYGFDSVHSCALFRVQHLKAGQFFGRFNTLEGSFTFDGTGETPPTFDVAIPIESVGTNNGRLDGHLRSPDFFNAAEFPAMTFKSTGATKTGERTWAVTGDLTLPSRLLICLVMFLGRVGPLTLLLALASRGEDPRYEYPQERVSLG